MSVGQTSLNFRIGKLLNGTPQWELFRKWFVVYFWVMKNNITALLNYLYIFTLKILIVKELISKRRKVCICKNKRIFTM